MAMNEINVKENNGPLIVGNNNVLSYICHCGENCHKTHQLKNASEGETIIEQGLPNLQLNNVDRNVLSDVANTRVCLCAVYQNGDHIVVENSLSRFVTNSIQNNCTHFEVQLKLKSCKVCKGNNVETTYESREFEYTLVSPVVSLDENIPLCLKRVHSHPEPETGFQAFLTRSQNIIKEEGNFIRIISRISENGRKVRIKLRFDVRSSVKRRRCYSLSDVDSLKRQLCASGKISEKSDSVSNIRQSCFTKSNSSLGKTHSAITILDGEVNIQEYDKPESTTNVQEAFAESIENEDDKIDGLDLNGNEDDRIHGLDLNGLEQQEIFAQGKFGPLYKISREGKEQLVKIVKRIKENENFLKEAEQFLKCRHPYIRPTAEILECHERYFVFYCFLDGHSLFEAIEDKDIRIDYVTFSRILFGMVKGLLYLQRKGIECQYLTPEKVLLDSHFNARIAGVGKSHLKSHDDAETNHGAFHRSLSYLDIHLRSKEEIHPKNVLWSVGRCIWDMLLGKICQVPGQQDSLSQFKFFSCLDKSCDDQKIKSVYFSDRLRKDVYKAGWPRDKEITKSLVVCAVRCMLMDLKERISLVELHNALETELYELQRKLRFPLYQNLDSHSLCLYCMKNRRDSLPLTCDCVTACNECLRKNGQLDCPEHGMHYSKIGHPLTYGVIIQGEFHENTSVCEKDSVVMEGLLNDQDIFAIKNFERAKSKSQREACDELKRIKLKFMGDKKKAKDGEKYPITLLLYITGHCNEAGSLILPDRSVLKKKTLCEFIDGIDPKHLIVLANGHYSEKLVKNLLPKKNNFLTSNKFFGVFSNAGDMCGVSHKEISDENSIFVIFILDILKKDQADAAPSTANEAHSGYLTAERLATKISNRMREKFNKCLKPINRSGSSIPITYI